MQEQKSYVVAVTGAGGLVGSHVTQELVARGHRVVAIVRKVPDFLEEIARQNKASGQLEFRIADVADQSSLVKAFSGADAVVHAAGSVEPFGARQAISATIVTGTKNALQAAKTAHVKHFIFISSLSVITGQGDQYDVDESASLKPCGESYADSKIAAEELVMNEAAATDLHVTSLRPGFIYGARERSWMPRLIGSIAGGKAMLIDGGTKQTNVINVLNLCRAVELALMNQKSYGQCYNLTDGEVVTKKQLFDAIADGLSLPRVAKKVPGVVAKAFCQLVSSVAPSLPVETQRKLARFSRAAFRLAGVNQGFSIAKAERELLYVERIPFQKGMSDTLEYFKGNLNATSPQLSSTSTR